MFSEEKVIYDILSYCVKAGLHEANIVRISDELRPEAFTLYGESEQWRLHPKQRERAAKRDAPSLLIFFFFFAAHLLHGVSARILHLPGE